MASLHPALTEELVRQLLDEGEHSGLDYKTSLDVSDTAELVAVTKDIGAMKALGDGGFLIIGANDDGTLSGQVTEAHASLLDEARLRGKLAKYLPEPVQIATRTVEIDGERVVVIHVAPHPSGFAVFKADGNYMRNEKPATEFRAGDVFIRRGTSSERCRQEDWEGVIERIVVRRKETWRAELREELTHLGVGVEAQRLAQGPAGALTWQLDSEAFSATIVELLRAGDTIPITLLLDRLVREAQALLQDANRADELETLLDRVAAVAALGLTLYNDELFERALSVLVAIYNVGFDQHGHTRSDLAVQPPMLWRLIAQRVMALGGLAVRRKNWSAVRQLALQRGRGDDFWTNWLRHAITMAARAGLMSRREGNREIELSLIALAQEDARREDALRPDVGPDDDALLDSLTQFDVFAAMAVFDATSRTDSRDYYPSFSRYNWSRSEPAVVALIQDEEVRAVIFPRKDEELAVAISELARLARSESFRYMVLDSWDSKVVTEFLQRSLPADGDAS